jgi:hypothetical protein
MLAQEVATARGEFQARLQELTARYAACHDAAEAAALQAQIADLKTDLELRMLEIQLRHARARGATAIVAEIEQALATVQGRRALDGSASTPEARRLTSDPAGAR